MPLLSLQQAQELLELAKIHGVCNECFHRTAMDYCRTCDEFYWIHRRGCAMFTDKHYGHRLTICPYTEER